jgi:hypothetical protein
LGDFLEDCIRYGKLDFWRTGFPWAEINACIDNETFEFIGSQEAIQNFETMTGQSWDSLSEDNIIEIRCPKCASTHAVPWTDWGKESAWITNSASRSKFIGETEAAGYADKPFGVAVDCGIFFDHELFKTQNFRRDLVALRSKDIPMPCTILNIDGSCS